MRYGRDCIGLGSTRTRWVYAQVSAHASSTLTLTRTLTQSLTLTASLGLALTLTLTITGLGRCWLVNRTRQVSQIMQAVLVRPRKQLQVVLGTQSGNINVLRQLLDCDTGSGGEDIDAVGIAPYFNGYAKPVKHKTKQT